MRSCGSYVLPTPTIPIVLCLRLNDDKAKGIAVPNRIFLERVSGLLFREALGEELARAKRNGDRRLVVRHGSEVDVYARIIIGIRPPQVSVNCGDHVLVRAELRHTLNEYVREGHARFFDHHNLTSNHAANSHFILYRDRLCDLKAMARVSLNLEPGQSLVHSPIVAQAVVHLGFTFVHFLIEPLNDSKTINLMETKGQERDGLRYGRSGEGGNHKKLRLWVKNNPAEVIAGLRGVKPKTEVPLDSGDRVDVVYYCNGKTVAIEVKSSDSDQNDLKRGIYQCVKYQAVLCAQYRAKNKKRVVSSLLVTQRELDDELIELAKKLNVEHKVVSLN